jgi:DNA-binding CsgD family transcriptional regulator
MAHRRGDYTAAQSLAEERLALARAQGDRLEMAWSLAYLGMVAVETDGDPLTLFEESLALFREIDDPAGVAEVLNMLGEVNRRRGDFASATRLYKESLALWQELGNEQYVAMILHNLGRVAQRQRASERAASVLVESLTRFQELEINNGVALCLRGLAGVAVDVGRLEAATRFLAAADTLAERAGVVEDVADREQSELALAAARTGLGVARFTTIWAAGRDLTIETAVAEALAFAESSLSVDPIAELTPRERAVARLVARGLTNLQIAAELGSAERTIDTHVSRILHKLGVASRHDIAAHVGDCQTDHR